MNFIMNFIMYLIMNFMMNFREMLVHSDHQDLQVRQEELDLPDFQESRDWMDQAVAM